MESIFYSRQAEAQITLPTPEYSLMQLDFIVCFTQRTSTQVESKKRQDVYKCSLLLLYLVNMRKWIALPNHFLEMAAVWTKAERQPDMKV